MSRARDFADLAGSADAGGLTGKNKFINGSFLVAQRGTSSTSAGYVSLDRWYVSQSGGSTTFSQETNSNPSETGGLQKYARLNVSTSSDFTSIRQAIEDVASVPAGTYTLSFWAKGTAPTGGLRCWATQDFGSGGSSDVDISNVTITSSLTSSWVRYTAQITIPSIDGKTIGAGSFLLINIGQFSNTATTAYDLNITGAQLEVGSATPFEHRSYGDELLRCKRYFTRMSDTDGSGHDGLAFAGLMANNTAARLAGRVLMPMRTDPTLSVTNDTQFSCRSYPSSFTPSSGMSFQSHDNGAFIIACTAPSNQNAGYAITIESTGGHIDADAEL